MRHHITLFAAIHITGCYVGVGAHETEEEEASGTAITIAGSDESGSESGEPGDPTICEPGAQVACYSGPEGTLGVGRCVAGVGTCLEDGRLGRCEGARAPVAEDCGTEEDDDCNGSTACGEFQGTRIVAPSDTIHALVAAGESVYVAWSAAGSVRLGRFLDGEVASVDLGTGVGGDAIHLDVDGATGEVWLAATLGVGTLPEGVLEDDCAPFEGDADVLLARFDPGLVLLDRRCFGDEHRQRVTSLDVGDDGRVLIAGMYSDILELPAGADLPAARHHELAFVASIDATLTATHWVHDLDVGALATVEGPSVVGTPDGSVVVFGTVNGGFDAFGGDDLFVNRYLADGAESWTKRFGNAADQRALSVGVGAGEHLWIAAETAGQVGLGAEPVGDKDPFMLLVARLDLDDGAVAAHRHVAGPNLVARAGNRAMFVEPDGEVALAGFAFEGYTIGPFAAPATDGSDAVLTKLGPDATPLWNHRLGGVGNQTGVAVVPGPHGLLFAGDFVGSMAVDGSSLSADTRAMFVLHYGD